MPKVLSLKQLLNKKYKYLEGLPEKVLHSFGRLAEGFSMIIWGESGNGKSNLIMQLMAVLAYCGKVLYLGLEEGHAATMQQTASRHMNIEQHAGKIEFADHTMTYEELVKRLRRKKSAKFIVIDSVQYWDITIDQYKSLKEEFKRKSFIYISHADGKQPDGKLAKKIKYDVDVKVHVEGCIAFPRSRYGGNLPYLIHEDGAKRYWGKELAQKLKPPTIKKTSKAKEEKSDTIDSDSSQEPTKTHTQNETANA